MCCYQMCVINFFLESLYRSHEGVIILRNLFVPVIMRNEEHEIHYLIQF